MSQKYSEEYYALKAELAELQEQLSAFENAGGRAQKFLKLTERYAAFTDLTPAILNEFISRIEVHERDKKRAKQAIQHIGIYFNYIGKFENEVTQLTEPTEQEIRQMREEIEEAKKEKSRAYHRQYSREYRARNLEKQREYDRIKAREYRARRKAQTAAAQPAQSNRITDNQEGCSGYGKSLFCARRKEPPMTEQNGTPTAPRNPDSIITTQRNGQTIVAELFFNHSSTETFRDKLLKTILADSSCLSASDGQEPEKSEILR